MLSEKLKQWLKAIPVVLSVMLLFSFSIFSNPAFAIPQDLADWCIGIDDCEVTFLGNKDNGKFVAEVLLIEDEPLGAEIEVEAGKQCRSIENLPPWGASGLEIEDDVSYYFTTDHYLTDYKCLY